MKANKNGSLATQTLNQCTQTSVLHNKERCELKIMKNHRFDRSFELVFLTKMRKRGGVIGGERALKTGP